MLSAVLLFLAGALPAWSMIFFIGGIFLFVIGTGLGWRPRPEVNPWASRLSEIGFFFLVLSIAMKVVLGE